MAAPSLTYTLTNGQSADAAQLMQDLNDLLNGITDGSKDLSINAFTAAGTATFNGSVALGNATSDTVTYTGRVASTIIPSTTLTYDLGSSSLTWNNCYGKAFIGTSSTTTTIFQATTTGANTNCSIGMTNDAQTWSLNVRGDLNDNFELIDNTAGVTRLAMTTAGLVTFTSTVDGTTAFTINAGGSSIDASSDVALSLQFNGDADPTNARFVQFGRSGNNAIGSISATSASAVAYNTTSDERLKTNIRPLEYGMETVRALDMVRFEWKDGDQSDFGTIAQKAWHLVPEAVRRPENEEENWAMEYSKLVPVLWNALRQADERICELEARAA
jgi:hypothetical protein